MQHKVRTQLQLSSVPNYRRGVGGWGGRRELGDTNENKAIATRVLNYGGGNPVQHKARPSSPLSSVKN